MIELVTAVAKFTFYYIYIKTTHLNFPFFRKLIFTFYYIYIKTLTVYFVLLLQFHLHSIIFILKRYPHEYP